MTGDALATPHRAANGVTRADEQVTAAFTTKDGAAYVLSEALLDGRDLAHMSRVSAAYLGQVG